MRHVAVLVVFLCSTCTLYSQHKVSGAIPGAKTVAAPPLATNMAYPQSLFVDSQNGNIWVADFDNNRVLRYDVSSLTGVEELRPALTLKDYTLTQNYPNPFNPVTTITFALRNTEPATVTVFDLLGREVATLFNGEAVAHKIYAVRFDAKNMPSGMYFFNLRTATRNEVRKMSVLK